MKETFNLTYSFITDDNAEATHVSKTFSLEDGAVLDDVLGHFTEFLLSVGYSSHIVGLEAVYSDE